jgi:hypothetical protein
LETRSFFIFVPDTTASELLDRFTENKNAALQLQPTLKHLS